MARTAKLKVYRTPIGFHDAYVAAPSMKAAIEAWGSSKDIFTRGEAELVTDARLTGEPLAHPGKVIKRLRGTAAEQLAALPAKPPARQRKSSGPAPAEASPGKSARKPVRRIVPRPSRTALDEADAAMEDARRKHGRKLERLRAQEAALAKQRVALESAQESELRKLQRVRDKAAESYERALQRWREAG